MSLQDKRNVLTFLPPGFKNEISAQFPDGRLAVCDGCKKNFKTRRSCRITCNHTGAPWSTAFVCVTIDKSCLSKDGKEYVDQTFFALPSRCRPFKMRRGIGLESPVCYSCKKINHARKFCRERHKHKELPWSTVYVTVFPSSRSRSGTSETVDSLTSNSVQQNNLKRSLSDASRSSSLSSFPDGNVSKKTKTSNSSPKSCPKTGKQPSESGNNAIGFTGIDDVNDIQESRTFLVGISSSQISLQWLDISPDEIAHENEPIHQSLPQSSSSQSQFQPFPIHSMDSYEGSEDKKMSTFSNYFPQNFKFPPYQFQNTQSSQMVYPSTHVVSPAIPPPVALPVNPYEFSNQYFGHPMPYPPPTQQITNQFNNFQPNTNPMLQHEQYSHNPSFSGGEQKMTPGSSGAMKYLGMSTSGSNQYYSRVPSQDYPQQINMAASPYNKNPEASGWNDLDRSQTENNVAFDQNYNEQAVLQASIASKSQRRESAHRPSPQFRMISPSRKESRTENNISAHHSVASPFKGKASRTSLNLDHPSLSARSRQEFKMHMHQPSIVI